ncbi:hypothetical protein Pst134EA_030629 [Puccinia striiformis f. sp. tritici]|uniref:hypothetical protein n=1 Tax=Puccinia striiformis f. sp. tritici TaxID=168172 RepID=UPI0020085001|nr:hypothetical protein Pst134EA_030629 [Puccinia striiformis f. sp. tritici]KAH9440547.1 hypothetical protein Pst134EB_031156 [Puccinia striiformis f. sp. tritici]KAH9446722.1 hypothetical protein Pst134EA_030629 [Puccinia striiformis f. sp. tritici]KAI9601985.1 hypothetical protein KEM48_001275 [Puccinia striiformis f. sp. tritici PST-130]
MSIKPPNNCAARSEQRPSLPGYRAKARTSMAQDFDESAEDHKRKGLPRAYQCCVMSFHRVGIPGHMQGPLVL